MAVRVYFPPVVEPPEFTAFLFESLIIMFVNIQKSLIIALKGVGEALDVSGIAGSKCQERALNR